MINKTEKGMRKGVRKIQRKGNRRREREANMKRERGRRVATVKDRCQRREK